jgi:hypothetical protein
MIVQQQQQAMMRQMAGKHLRLQGRGQGALVMRLKSFNQIKNLKNQLRMQQQGVKRLRTLLQVQGSQGWQHVAGAWQQMAVMEHILQGHSSQAQR